MSPILRYAYHQGAFSLASILETKGIMIFQAKQINSFTFVSLE